MDSAHKLEHFVKPVALLFLKLLELAVERV